MPAPPSLTSTPEPAVPVTSLEEIVGTWLTFCGARQCAFEVHADGTYLSRYVSATRAGASVIERGTITLIDGVFQLAAASGVCEGMADAFYQARLIRLDGSPHILQLDATRKDECADRYDALARDMKYSDE